MAVSVVAVGNTAATTAAVAATDCTSFLLTRKFHKKDKTTRFEASRRHHSRWVSHKKHPGGYLFFAEQGLLIFGAPK